MESNDQMCHYFKVNYLFAVVLHFQCVAVIVVVCTDLFSLYVRALDMIKRCNFLQPLGNLFLFPPHFCVAVINSDTNSANSQETGKYI